MDALDLARILARLARLPRDGVAQADGPRAAVATVLREPRAGAEPEVLLIRRAEDPNDPWSGHMAFPGGRREPSDPDLLATALRETREEIGLDLVEHGELVARLPDLDAMARGRRAELVITPFVFALRREVPFVLSDEVAEVIWAPLGALARGELSSTMPYDHQGVRLELPCYRIEGRVVWGLTHRMLESLFVALLDA